MKKLNIKNYFTMIALAIIFLCFNKSTVLGANYKIDTDYTDVKYHGKVGKWNTFGTIGKLSVNGDVAFCLDPATAVNNNNYSDVVEFKEGTVYNKDGDSLTLDLQEKLTNIVYWGWDKSEDKSKRTYALTQLSVWRALGHHSETFTSGGITASDIDSFLNRINTLASKNVSFNGFTYDIGLNKSLTITDSNNILQYLDVENSSNGFEISQNGNSLTIKASANAKPTIISGKYKNVYSERKANLIYKRKGSQTLGVLRDPYRKKLLLNLNIEQPYFRILKLDKETKQPIGNTVFEVSHSEDFSNSWTMTTNTAETDKNNIGYTGFIKLSTDQIGKRIYVREKSVPSPYVLDTSVKWADINNNEIVFTFENERKKGNILVKKVGKQIVGTKKELMDGYTVTVPIIEEKPLKDVKIALYNDKGVQLKIGTTNNNGIIAFNKLDIGKYTLKEIETKDNFKLLKKPIEVDLKLDKSFEKVVSVTEKIENKAKQLKIRFSKEFEKSKFNRNIKKATFGLYLKKDKSFFHADDLLDIKTTDENNSIEFKTYLDGEFYIKELKTDTLYQLDKTNYDLAYKFTNAIDKNIDKSTKNAILYDTDNTNDIITFKKPLINKLIRGELELLKTDEHSVRLKGVVFELRKKGSDKPLGTYITDDKGKLSIKNLEYGKYELVETKTLNNYILDGKPLNFEINKDKYNIHSDYKSS